MLRILTNIPLPIHFILLLFIFLIRLPSLLGGYYLEEESLYYLCAQQLSQSGSLYKDAWLAGPPLMVSIYWVAYKLFGTGALLFMRIIACFYLYFSAVYFVGMLENYKLYKRYPYLPAFLFAFLVSIPWYTQTFSASLLALFPIIFSFHVIIRLNEQRNRSYALLLQVGILMSICLLASYKIVFILLGIMIAYLIIVSPRIDELLAMIAGVFVVLFLMIVFMHFSGTLVYFWEIGCLYYLDRIRLGTELLYQYNIQENLLAWLLSTGIIVLLALIGFFHYRLKFYNYVVKIRSVESTMRIWMLIMFVTLVFKYKRLDLQDFILLVPPIVFYAGKCFDFKWRTFIRVPLIILSIGIPIYLFSGFLGLKYPSSFPYAKPAMNTFLLHGGTFEHFSKDTQIRSYFSAPDKENNVWIMGEDPTLYLQLGVKCANKYTDFRIAYNKMESFRDQHDQRYYSSIEPHAEIFRQFYHNPPAYIVDPDKNFSYLQAKYPSLFSKYKPRLIDNITVYRKEE